MLSKYLLINMQYFAQSNPNAADPSATIQVIQNDIVPVISWATNWGITAGFGMLGVVLFYQVVIILVKPDK